MAHGDAWEGKWRGNWRMQWVASTLHTTSQHGVSSITTADAHTSAASSRLNWRRPSADLNRLVRFARKRKSVFCTCAITFQTQSTGVQADGVIHRQEIMPDLWHNKQYGAQYVRDDLPQNAGRRNETVQSVDIANGHPRNSLGTLCENFDILLTVHLNIFILILTNLMH